MHSIGSPSDVTGLQDANDGRIKWLEDLSFGNWYPIINDCMAKTMADPPSCSGNAVLRSDLLPIVFNHPAMGLGSMHGIGLVFDPWKLDDGYSIKAMFAIDGDTVDNPYWTHPQWTKTGDQDGWTWADDYDGQGGVFSTTDVPQAMNDQCYFALADDDSNWAGFWGNFIDARKGALNRIRDNCEQGMCDALPDQSSYLEPEINVEIVSPEAWKSMYENALKAVTVQTNYCSEQLGSPKAIQDFCPPTSEEEDKVIRLGKYGACRVAQQINQDTKNPVPVIEANYLTNSMYNQDAWNNFWDGTEYIAEPEQYLQFYDCCWLLTEKAAFASDGIDLSGWMDGQCCKADDGAGEYWKNCAY